MTTSYPPKLSIAWLMREYKKGSITPMQVVEEIISRAQLVEDYHIYIVKPDREMAEKYISRLPKDVNELPLWGIPFVIKDNIDLEGYRTTAACEAYGYMPKESATVVQKLIENGAIPVGKTNMDQFATGLVGTRSPYGEVKNALNPELISGGSSSGSAVAVALGLASFGLGTDTAGSGRVPAALNAIVGYKPSCGAWSSKGVVPACASLDCVTVFAGSIEETELVNKIARGFDTDCPWSKNILLSGEKLPSKICLPKQEISFYGDYAETYKTKWNQCVDRLKSTGIPVEYIDYDIFSKAASILYDGPWVAERFEDLGDFIGSHRDEVFPVTEKIIMGGGREGMMARDVYHAMHKLAEYKMEARKLLGDGVLVMPTCAGTFTREQVRNNPIETNSNMGLYTNHCNLLDMCAIAVPQDEGDTEIPFGITIFGDSSCESSVVRMAKAFEATRTMRLAVCGLHKKGYPLEHQLTSLGASFLESTVTDASYRLYELPTAPVKPGMVYDPAGAEIAVDIYEIPVASFGAFMNYVKKPLVIGDIILKDNRVVKGFLCEASAVAGKGVKEITGQGAFLL